LEFDRDFWLRELSRWNEPQTFDDLVMECHRQLGQFGAMIHHGTGFWRDAWIASKFSRQSSADHVRLLHPDPSPDFAVRRNGAEALFEATEAMRAGRRRGDEFREDLDAISRGETPIRQDPVEEWLTPETANQMLNAAATRKSGKAYAGGCGLVIYLNESNYDSDEQGIIETFGLATKPAGERYRSVHILWKERFWPTWSEGIQA